MPVLQTAQRLTVATFATLVFGLGAAHAATPTATDPSQNSAATPAQADQPRLPTADDTHRTGPAQSQAGSGAVPAVPETLQNTPSKDELGASSADRMEAGKETRENGGAAAR